MKVEVGTTIMVDGTKCYEKIAGRCRYLDPLRAHRLHLLDSSVGENDRYCYYIGEWIRDRLRPAKCIEAEKKANDIKAALIALRVLK